MRTTVTLDPDTAELVRREMRERSISFKQVLDDLIRRGATARRGIEPFRTATASLGTSAVNLDRALARAADFEDDDLLRDFERFPGVSWTLPPILDGPSTTRPG